MMNLTQHRSKILFVFIFALLITIIAFTDCSPTRIPAPTPYSSLAIADTPASLPISANVNLLPYSKGRLEEFHSPKYSAATEGCAHVSAGVMLLDGQAITLTLESDCPIDWYGDWDHPRAQIGILFPQMKTYSEDSGWITISSGTIETRHITSSNGGRQVEVVLIARPDNSGADIPNLYKLYAINLDPNSSHYLKYSVSSYTATPLPPVTSPILGMEIREVKIHDYRPAYDAEGRVDPSLIEATFSWVTNKPCYFWFTEEPLSFDSPKNEAGIGFELFDVSHPLPQSLQTIQHSHDILLRPGALHRYELTVWDEERNSARKEGTFQAEDVSMSASSPQPESIVDDIFLSRWGHAYYNNAPRVKYGSDPFGVDKLIMQTNLQIFWQLCYEANVFDCSEMAAYLEYVLERHGYTAEIAYGVMKGIGFHAWVLVYNNVADCWVPVEATSPTGTWDWFAFQLVTGNKLIDYLKPQRKWTSIYEVAPISEYDWWNSSYADQLVAASDSLK
jgi:hypothetical protein